MPQFIKCEICGEYGWLENHKCAPAWWACNDPLGVEYIAMTVYANHADDAAEKYAKKHDRMYGDGPQEYQDVYVRQLNGDEKMYKVSVAMEFEPMYYALTPVEYTSDEITENAESDSVDESR